MTVVVVEYREARTEHSRYIDHQTPNRSNEVFHSVHRFRGIHPAQPSLPCTGSLSSRDDASNAVAFRPTPEFLPGLPQTHGEGERCESLKILPSKQQTASVHPCANGRWHVSPTAFTGQAIRDGVCLDAFCRFTAMGCRGTKINLKKSIAYINKATIFEAGLNLLLVASQDRTRWRLGAATRLRPSAWRRSVHSCRGEGNAIHLLGERGQLHLHPLELDGGKPSMGLFALRKLIEPVENSSVFLAHRHGKVVVGQEKIGLTRSSKQTHSPIP